MDHMQGRKDEFMFSEDDFEIRLTPAHCRAARGWLGWTQAELSQRSKVGLSTIKDYENEIRRTHRKAIQMLLQDTFAKAGVWCSKEGIWDERLIDLDVEPQDVDHLA
jgi:transcriptional regulator with XRE-family HTH domain